MFATFIQAINFAHILSLAIGVASLAQHKHLEFVQAIPEIGDHTIKKQKRETYTPVPDTILTGKS